MHFHRVGLSIGLDCCVFNRVISSKMDSTEVIVNDCNIAQKSVCSSVAHANNHEYTNFIVSFSSRSPMLIFTFTSAGIFVQWQQLANTMECTKNKWNCVETVSSAHSLEHFCHTSIHSAREILFLLFLCFCCNFHAKIFQSRRECGFRWLCMNMRAHQRSN